MDQETFFKTDPNDLTVDLHVAPTSGEQYLKQVMRSRDFYCPDVVRVDPKLFQPTSSGQQATPVAGLHALNDAFKAPAWWCDRQCADFSELREKFRRHKMSKHSTSRVILSDDDLPELGDELSWKTFIFSTCAVDLSQFDLSKKIDGDCSGTPPLFGILASLSQPHVIDAFEFCVEWFCDEGDDEQNEAATSKPVACHRLNQWLFALMCAIEKPIDPDVCSALRRLAKHSMKILGEFGNDPKISENDRRILEWFICIVAYYFDQKDLLL